jgi:hypothetical protein
MAALVYQLVFPLLGTVAAAVVLEPLELQETPLATAVMVQPHLLLDHL